MRRLLFCLLIFCSIEVIHAQTFLVKKNIISTSLQSLIINPSGYSISYERMLDRGRSPNVAQLSFKLNYKLINDKDDYVYDVFQGVELKDKDAYTFDGHAFVPEFKYYFTWDAPNGPYFSLYGTYESYQENFVNINDQTQNYEKKISALGRGLGLGYQIRITDYLNLDLGGGYLVQDTKSKRKLLLETAYIDLPNEKKDGIRIVVGLGVGF